MAGDKQNDPNLVIQQVDKLGRPVEKDLLDAARHNWKRVVAYAERQGQDGSVAAEALESTVHWLALLGNRHPRFRQKINNLKQYVFVVAVHRLNRLAARQAPVEFVGSLDDLDLLRETQGSTWGGAYVAAIDGRRNSAGVCQLTNAATEGTRVRNPGPATRSFLSLRKAG